MSAALRLERFGVLAPPPAVVTPADVENAWQLGHEAGLVQGREQGLDALTAELRQISLDLRMTTDEASRIRRDTMNAVVPILQTIVDVLGPAFARERLLDGLRTELEQVAQTSAGAALTIHCASDLRQDIEYCISRAGLSDIVLHDACAPSQRAEIRMQGGSIALDPASAVPAIKTLICELNHEE